MTVQTRKQIVLGRYALWRVHKMQQLAGHLHHTKSTKWQKMITQDDASEFDKLKGVAQKAQDTLMKVKAVFPFDLFPDVITVDRQKVTIHHRTFFMMQHSVSVQHQDIKTVEVTTGPFFGSLIITSESFSNNTQRIHYLWKHDAINVRRMLQGAMIAARENVDTTDINKDDLIKHLDELGKGATTPPVN